MELCLTGRDQARCAKDNDAILQECWLLFHPRPEASNLTIGKARSCLLVVGSIMVPNVSTPLGAKRDDSECVANTRKRIKGLE